MEADFPVNVSDEEGNPFLYTAIEEGIDAYFAEEIENMKSIVQILVDAGADVNARTAEGQTLLYIAIEGGIDAYFAEEIENMKSIVQILVDAGADVNVRSATDGNPVLYSSFFWSSDIVEILVDAGADVNARTAEGQTLLYEAVRLLGDAYFDDDRARYTRIVEILLNAGADDNMTTREPTSTAAPTAASVPPNTNTTVSHARAYGHAPHRQQGLGREPAAVRCNPT